MIEVCKGDITKMDVDIIVNAAGNPTIRYIDKGGVEREVPLYFRNGLKSLFQVELKIDL